MSESRRCSRCKISQSHQTQQKQQQQRRLSTIPVETVGRGKMDTEAATRMNADTAWVVYCWLSDSASRSSANSTLLSYSLRLLRWEGDSYERGATHWPDHPTCTGDGDNRLADTMHASH